MADDQAIMGVAIGDRILDLAGIRIGHARHENDDEDVRLGANACASELR